MLIFQAQGKGEGAGIRTLDVSCLFCLGLRLGSGLGLGLDRMILRCVQFWAVGVLLISGYAGPLV